MTDYQLTQTGSQVQTALDKVGTTALSTTATDLSNAVNELVTDIGGNTTKIGDLDNLVTTAKTDTVSAINEVATDLRGGNLFKLVQYSASYTISANGSLSLTANDLDMSTPSGYTPIAVVVIGSGNSNVAIRYVNATATGTSNALGFRSVSTASLTASATLQILYVKVWGS